MSERSLTLPHPSDVVKHPRGAILPATSPCPAARSHRRRADVLPDRLAVSAITVGELRAGVLAAADLATRDRRLATLTAVLALDSVPVDEDVAGAWARLRVALRDLGRRMAVSDSWIAATAIALDIPLVTQDDGHLDVPGLKVIRA